MKGRVVLFQKEKLEKASPMRWYLRRYLNIMRHWALGDLWGRHSRRDKERRQWNSKRLNVGPKITELISLGPCSRILICPGCCTMPYTAQNSLPNKEWSGPKSSIVSRLRDPVRGARQSSLLLHSLLPWCDENSTFLVRYWSTCSNVDSCASFLWQECNRPSHDGWRSHYGIQWAAWCSVLFGDWRGGMESLAGWPF